MVKPLRRFVDMYNTYIEYIVAIVRGSSLAELSYFICIYVFSRSHGFVKTGVRRLSMFS